MKRNLLMLLCLVSLQARAEPFAIDAIDDDIKTVLRSIAITRHLGIIIPSELGGKVSVSIESDKWQQIFTALLEPRGYTHRIQNGVIIIEEEPLIQKSILSNFITGPELLASLNGYKTERGTLTAYPEGVIARDTTEAISAMSNAALNLGDSLPRVSVQCRFFETTLLILSLLL